MPLETEIILPAGQSSTHFPKVPVLMSEVLCVPYKLHWKCHLVNLALDCRSERKEKLLYTVETST